MTLYHLSIHPTFTPQARVQKASQLRQFWGRGRGWVGGDNGQCSQLGALVTVVRGRGWVRATGYINLTPSYRLGHLQSCVTLDLLSSWHKILQALCWCRQETPWQHENLTCSITLTNMTQKTCTLHSSIGYVINPCSANSFRPLSTIYLLYAENNPAGHKNKSSRNLPLWYLSE